MVEFTAKDAIVTGAASGIGRTSNLFYAREGVNVVVSDDDKEGGNKIVRLIHEIAGKAIFVKSDTANPADCEVLVRRTSENYSRLNLTCNNAGIGGEQSQTADYSIEGWQKVIAVNLSGVYTE